jgi:hypothetical protein
LELLNNLRKQDEELETTKGLLETTKGLFQDSSKKLDSLQGSRLIINRKSGTPFFKLGKTKKEYVPKQFENPNFTSTP